nr:MAG TPA: hypothetical protein [Caudoviricetes sp.]
MESPPTKCTITFIVIMQYLQKSKIKQNVLEITENVIYDIATKDIAPRTIYHTGATPSRRERSNNNDR